MKKYILSIYICFAAIVLFGCKKNIDNNIRPFNDKADKELLSTLDGLATATNGNYSLMVTQAAGDTQYDVTWFNLSELKGNNILSVTQAYPQTRNDSYIYNNSPSQGVTAPFWRMSYRIIFGTNKVIDAISEGQGAAYDQLKGENYFLRAMAYFNLARVYGRPYYQDNAVSLAVPISLNSLVDKNYQPKRNTVKEVYAQIISDLEKAATLMTISKTNNYASKEVAWALLSRVYLYMGGTPAAPQNEYNTKSVEYADKVIASNKYTLLQGTAYSTSFAVDSRTNKEAIFSFRHDDANGNKINEFLMLRDVFGNPYQGEYAASPDYMAILNQNSSDLRKSFITVETDKRITLTDKSRNSINKFNFQQLSAPGGFDFSTQTRSGTPYLRIAEMYLNKAEALAKLNNNTDALIALNLVRTRSTAPEWTTASLATAGMTVFQAVLNERRLELAWEGHSSYDNFRNGLPVVRNYTDYFYTSPLTIQATDKRVVYPLPPSEILLNNNLDQNPL
ncbi:RagB/SusD family nutrient uptake outer membrane protein [Pedobacter sp. MC2016-14]|uniref:RagB/SusD family nutrient uptake outer membrane protein n=1 Tax=Pedobacter sp. MC2016-14 TaxID=2897327 RepID=UPI001E4F04D8|nr:RagB/SusD family nutrient uptake outer membrane protein [Pedobacter sp. MC2016-14]MCD0488573.1 RagB/SusD family nutrient uptake outer membrane protein [Pedobacter sp. MC2016-14]